MQRTLISLVLPLIICCQNTSPDQAVTSVLNNLHLYAAEILMNAGEKMPFKIMVWLALKLAKAGPII